MAQPWLKYQEQSPSATPAGEDIVIARDPYKQNDEVRKNEDQKNEAVRLGIAASSEARAGRDEGFDNAAKLRDEFRKAPESTNYETVIRQFSSALSAQPTPTGDQALITAYAKMLDPGSVVREQEFNTVAAGDSKLGSIVARLQKEFGVDNSGLIRPEVRARVLQEMRNLADNYRASYDRVRGDYQNYADSYKIDPKLVLGSRIDDPYNQKIEQLWKERGINTPEQGDAIGISGGEAFSTDQDKAIAAAVRAAFQKGGGVEELKAAAEGAGGVVTPADLAAFNQAIEARSKKQPVTFNAQQTGRRNPVSRVLGEAAMTPVGTFATGALNAASIGALSLFAGDKVKGLESLNPDSAAWGEIAGAAIGTSALGNLTAKGVGRASGTLAERLAGGGALGMVGRTAATDAAYGGIYAANTGEDIGTGVALGALGSVVGQGVGAVAKRAVPAFRGMFRGNGDEVVPPFEPRPGGGAPPKPSPVSGMVGDAISPDAGDLANASDETFAPITRRFKDAGASGTSDDTMRLSKAEGLPVPVELTQGAATRDAEQLAFEKEQIFGPLGAPLRARAEENNSQILANFDKFVDMTGAELPDLASTGNAVTRALSKGYQQAKDRVNVAYKRAEAAGELAEPVSYKEVSDFIAEQTPTTREKLAPILNAVQEQLAKNDPDGTGQISLNAMEQVRKLINKASVPGTENGNFGGQLKGLIDQATEGKGGNLYRKARALRIEQARKFENRAVVERLVANVKNKADAKTTSDEVVRKSILTESPEDIKFLRHALKTSGKDGRQAWKELQGATIRHIQEQATKNVNITASNEPVVSAAGLNKVVSELDKSGRLDAVFDPATAQRLRDLRDVVQYINTVPPGTSINNSGTARTLVAYMAALGTEAGGMAALTGVPVPVITGLIALRGVVKDNRIKKKISQSLMPKNSISAAQSGDYMIN